MRRLRPEPAFGIPPVLVALAAAFMLLLSSGGEAVRAQDADRVLGSNIGRQNFGVNVNTRKRTPAPARPTLT